MMPSRREVEPRVVTVVSGRNEFQLYLMFLLIFSGLSLLILKRTSGSLESAYPTWFLYFWGLSITFGGAINIFAVLFRWRDVLTGLYLEMVSLFVVALGGFIYLAAVVLTVVKLPPGQQQYSGAALVGVLGIAAVWRFIRILLWTRLIRRIRAQYAAVTDISTLPLGDPTVHLDGTVSEDE